MAMLIEFDIPRQDLAQMNAELLQATVKRNLAKYRILRFVILIVFFGMIAYWIYIGAIVSPVVMTCFITSYAIFLTAVIGFTLQRRSVTRKMASTYFSGQRESIRILPSRIDHFTEKVNTTNAWKNVNSVLQTKNFLFLIINSGGVPIPLSAFNDIDHIDEFKRLAESYISGQPINAQTVPNDSVPTKPAHWPPAPSRALTADTDTDESDALPILGTPIDQSKAVKIPFSYDGHDLLQFNYRFCTKAMLQNGVLRLLQPLALCTFLVPIFVHSSVKTALLSITFLTIVLTGYFIWRINSQILKSLDKRSHENAEIELETDFVQFVIKTASSCANYQCSAFDSVKIGELGIYVNVGLGRFLPIPIRYFPDKQSAKEFYVRLKVVVQ